MRSCHQAEGLFGAFWDDEATVAERDWLESHFKACPRCRAEYDQYARTLEVVGQLPRHETRPDFNARVLAAARRASPVADAIRVRPVREVRWVPLAAAAAALVVAAYSVVSLQGGIASRRGAGAVAVAPPASQPALTAQAGPLAASVPAAEPRVAEPRAVVAVVTDSLFDHSADVEFMLEPVQLRRGRAHTGTRLPDGVQGDQVVITF